MIACKDSEKGEKECARYDCPRHTITNPNNVKARFKDQCGHYEEIQLVFKKPVL